MMEFSCVDHDRGYLIATRKYIEEGIDFSR